MIVKSSTIGFNKTYVGCVNLTAKSILYAAPGAARTTKSYQLLQRTEKAGMADFKLKYY